MDVQTGRQTKFVEAGMIENARRDDRDAIAMKVAAVAIFRRHLYGHQPPIEEDSGGELGEQLCRWSKFFRILFEIDKWDAKIIREIAENLSSEAPLALRRASSKGLPEAAASLICSAASASITPSCTILERISSKQPPSLG